MIIKQFILIVICFVSLQSIAQKSYKKEYSLTVSGQLTDEENKHISDGVIKITYNVEPVSISVAETKEISVDKSGKYSVELKKFGLYKIEITAQNKISYHIKTFYTRKMALGIRDRKSKISLDLQLMPQTKKIEVDIYNGGELIARDAVVKHIPYKRYLQAHDFEVKDGFKSTKKATKYITKKIQKLELPELMGILASRPEIDTVISSSQYFPEIRKRWQKFFGLTHPDIDKQRAELLQDFFTKISQKDKNEALIYKYESHTLDLTKTVQADDSKKVFNLYRYNFESAGGEKISFDIMLFRTLSGWKINYITENY